MVERSPTTARLGIMLEHDGGMASDFIDVDGSADPDRLVSVLDSMAVAMARTTSTLVKMLNIRAGQRILDLGCGAGHDLVAIVDAGGVAFGVDPSVPISREVQIVRRDTSRPESRSRPRPASIACFAARSACAGPARN